MTTATLPIRKLRNAGPAELVKVLQAHRRQSVDLVVPASSVLFHDGNLEIATAEPVIANDGSGVIDLNGAYRPTATADGQLAGIFGVPVKYVRRLREEFIGLLDGNINEWASHATYENKKVLVRILWGQSEDDDATVGIVRSFLSDRFGARDNYDTLLAMLDGMREAGLKADQVTITGNLSDDRMSVFVEAPEIFIHAPEFLENYRPPTGLPRIDPTRHIRVNDTIHAGFAITNSETGGGAMTVTPRITVLVCMNGLQITKDAFRKVHLGAKLDEGAIVWSSATRDAANTVAKEQIKDAVKAFMSPEYVQRAVDGLMETAGTPVTSPAKTIEVLAKDMAYTEDEAEGILNAFIQGGQATAGGFLQAVTAYAQMIEDPDRSFDIEASGVAAMEMAAALNR